MIKRLSLPLSILAGVLAASAVTANAQTTNCSGVLPAGAYASVNVPAGKFCTVNSAVDVAGNLTVAPGATLFVTAPAKLVVNSSLLAVDAANIDFEVAATILGNVTLARTTNFVQIQSSFIGGTLSIADSTASAINIITNNVAGSVLLRSNKTSGGPASDVIKGNTIGGSLVCVNNAPAPVNSATPNVVGGSKVGQCSGL